MCVERASAVEDAHSAASAVVGHIEEGRLPFRWDRGCFSSQLLEAGKAVQLRANSTMNYDHQYYDHAHVSFEIKMMDIGGNGRWRGYMRRRRSA